MRKKFKLIFPLLAFLLSSFTVQAAPEWSSVDVQTYYNGSVGALVPDSGSVSQYIFGYDVSGSERVPVVSWSGTGSGTNNIGSSTEHFTYSESGKLNSFTTNIDLSVDADYKTFYGFGGSGVGSWSSNTMSPGSYYGYFSFRFVPQFYTTSNKGVYVVGVTSARAWLADTELTCYWDQGVLFVSFPNPVYLTNSARFTVNFYFSGFFTYGSDSSDTVTSDDFRVNLGTTLYNPQVKYWSGNINDPENIDDFTAANNAFDSSLAAGEAAEKNLTDTAFVDVGSAADEYFVNPASGVLSGAAFYTACVTGLYNSLGDFQYILLIIITFIILRFIFRKVKGG